MRDPCSQHEPDLALTLKASLAPHFMTLRRLLAQLGGLVLLSGGKRSETWDGIAISLVALKSDLSEAQDGLQAVTDRAGGAALSLHRLQEAAAEISDVIDLMATRGLPSRPHHPTVLPLLQRAQRRLLSVADERAGFTMIAFSHACCCSVQPTVRHCA